MHKVLPLLSLLIIGCGSVSFTYNGLRCPTNDINVIENDMTECRVWNTKDIEKSFAKDPECKTCLEQKGYKIEAINSDNNASQ